MDDSAKRWIEDKLSDGVVEKSLDQLAKSRGIEPPYDYTKLAAFQGVVRWLLGDYDYIWFVGENRDEAEGLRSAFMNLAYPFFKTSSPGMALFEEPGTGIRERYDIDDKTLIVSAPEIGDEG